MRLDPVAVGGPEDDDGRGRGQEGAGRQVLLRAVDAGGGQQVLLLEGAAEEAGTGAGAEEQRADLK